MSDRSSEAERRRSGASAAVSRPLDSTNSRARGRLPLSSAQRRIWFLDRMDSGGAAYNIARATRFQGSLDHEALRTAHSLVAGRHVILRTRYPATAGVPHQVVDSSTAVDFRVVKLAPDQLNGYLTSEAGIGFDLAAGPMWRVRLIWLAADDHVLLTVIHHIAADGWSFPVIRAEVGEAYRAALAGRDPALPVLPAQYRDFALHQLEIEQTGQFATDLRYWRHRFGDDPDPVPLPSDRTRPATRTSEGTWVESRSSRTSPARLHEVAREFDATESMVGLALFAAFLARYARTSEVVVGIPHAQRSWKHAERLVGPFVNSLPIRIGATPGMSLRDLVGDVQREVLDALDHSAVPFDEIVRHVMPRRDSSHTPLFQVMYQFRDDTFRGDYALSGIAETMVQVTGSTSKFDLVLELSAAGDSLLAAFSVSRDLYDEASARRLVDAFGVFCDAAVANPDHPLEQAPLVAGWEHHWLVEERNATHRPLPADTSLVELHREVVAHHGTRLAIIDGPRQITHQELQEAAARIAARLEQAGVEPGKVVALQIGRSATLIAAMLAVAGMGAVYLPLDSTYPQERTRQMIERAGAQVVVTPCDGNDWSNIDITSTGAATAPLDRAEHPVYVIFTSGSTGVPKGVVVGRQSILRLVCNTDYVALGPGDRVAHLSNTAFDAATFEIWGALLNAATIVVLDQDTVLEPTRFAAALRTHAVSTVFVTTALFNLIAREAPAAFAPVRDVLFGGERCDPTAVRTILREGSPGRLLHVYGPTETTTFAAWHHVTDVATDATTVPIGQPTANTTLHVLDGWGMPLPPLLTGELHIGGPGVAIGYIKDADETSRRFIPDTFSDDPWGRLYRTGDLARINADGAIEFVGRIDRQVKLRGFRIEPQDVEHALRRHPAVRDAIVHLVGSGDDRRLIAWVVVPEGQIDEHDLRAHCAHLLPSYMTPAGIVALPAFPLTPNGKIDTAALPVALDRPGAVAVHRAEESRLAGLFERVLGVQGVGRTDSFFDLGGHSIRAVELISVIEAEFGRRLPVSTLFAAPTPAALADHLAIREPERLERVLVPMAPGGTAPPVFIFHHPSGTVLAYEALVRHLGDDAPVFGVQALGVDGTVAPRRTIEEMAIGYAELVATTAPSGPLRLVGHSLGGLLAWETARRLRNAGRKVSLLALLDTKFPDPTHRAMLRRMGYSRSAALARSVYRAVRRLGGNVWWGAQLVRYRLRHLPLPPELARIRLVRIASRAYEHYRPQPFDGTVTYFLATGGADADAAEVLRRWGAAAAEIEIVSVPGNHTGPDSLLAEPHVATLAEALNSRLGAHGAETPLSKRGDAPSRGGSSGDGYTKKRASATVPDPIRAGTKRGRR